MPEAMHDVALVLGAGGPVGAAFHAGVLRALDEVCGWDARSAGLIVGTSAGSQVGAQLRAGASANALFERVMTQAHGLPPREEAHRRWPASPAYLRAVLRRPWTVRPGRLVSALLPEGRRASAPHARTLHPLAAWPEQALWITAVHLDSGTRVAFGRAGAPVTDVATAVQCSSAVPGVRRPVELAGHRYIDGGIASPTHLDLLASPSERASRVAVVLSPLSRFQPMRLLLAAEVRRLRAQGIQPIVLEPSREVMMRMGWNPLDARIAPQVAEVSYREAVRLLSSRGASPWRALLSRTRSTAATTASASR